MIIPKSAVRTKRLSRSRLLGATLSFTVVISGVTAATTAQAASVPDGVVAEPVPTENLAAARRIDRLPTVELTDDSVIEISEPLEWEQQSPHAGASLYSDTHGELALTDELPAIIFEPMRIEFWPDVPTMLFVSYAQEGLPWIERSLPAGTLVERTWQVGNGERFTSSQTTQGTSTGMGWPIERDIPDSLNGHLMTIEFTVTIPDGRTANTTFTTPVYGGIRWASNSAPNIPTVGDSVWLELYGPDGWTLPNGYVNSFNFWQQTISEDTTRCGRDTVVARSYVVQEGDAGCVIWTRISPESVSGHEVIHSAGFWQGDRFRVGEPLPDPAHPYRRPLVVDFQMTNAGQPAGVERTITIHTENIPAGTHLWFYHERWWDAGRGANYAWDDPNRGPLGLEPDEQFGTVQADGTVTFTITPLFPGEFDWWLSIAHADLIGPIALVDSSATNSQWRIVVPGTGGTPTVELPGQGGGVGQSHTFIFRNTGIAAGTPAGLRLTQGIAAQRQLDWVYSTIAADGSVTFTWEPRIAGNWEWMLTLLPFAGDNFWGQPIINRDLWAGTQTVAPGFSDVASDNPFRDNIAWLASTGITTGWTLPDGRVEFRGGQAINRMAMAAFLFRAAGEPSFPLPAAPSFADVPATHSFYKAIEWMAYARISEGWVEAGGSRTFRPEQPVTREAMASFLHRFHGAPALSGTASASFTDVAAGSVHRGAVEWMAQHGISTGWTLAGGGAEFRPAQPVTREAMAAFLHRAHTYSHAGQFPTGHWNLGR